MARVFTIEFSFLNHNYKGIVVVKNNASDLKIYVRVFDDKLSNILGNDSIEFVGLTGYRELNLTHKEALPLLDCINQSIVRHLLN